MIPFDELNVLPDRTITLYERYHATVIEDIARRLSRLNMLTSTSVWQMNRLIAAGKVYDKALEELAKLTGVSKEELRRAFGKAGVRTLEYDDAIYRKAGFEPLPLELDRPMMEVLAAGYKKTMGHLINLTRTTALTAQTAFIESSDMAYMQVSTGAFDYDTAIKNAVIEVADRGLTVIYYPTGHRNQMDVAVRRAVLTGVSQTAAEVQLRRMEEMGISYVAVSAHVGARNEGEGPMNHESWQGKIYAIDGPKDGYEDFVTTTGYGTGEGLHGWNCRHSFYPFIPGISPEPVLTPEAYAGKTVTYNQAKVDFYRATQMQRRIERKIRKAKREKMALEAAGLDPGSANQKIRELWAEMRDFIKQTGLKRHYEREQVRY